ncbi:MAG: signal peptidase [Gaiellaceae bacterium]|nr:signal peptidase [Gaiellaceae bacterium]MDX6487945.1 signal peptidase [Gaiellaceae bacterium]
MTAAFPAVAAAVLVLDQWSKRLALHSLTGVEVPGLRLALNGRWASAPAPALIALWALTAASVVLAVRSGPFGVPLAELGLAAALGGAAGNLLDRVRRGVVVDFVALWRWPPFNLADAAIVTGVGLALLAAL